VRSFMFCISRQISGWPSEEDRRDMLHECGRTEVHRDVGGETRGKDSTWKT
jgi:hypothetical protein